MEREVNELEERAAEASKLTEPRENSYIEFRVMMMMLLLMMMMMPRDDKDTDDEDTQYS